MSPELCLFMCSCSSWSCEGACRHSAHDASQHNNNNDDDGNNYHNGYKRRDDNDSNYSCDLDHNTRNNHTNCSCTIIIINAGHDTRHNNLEFLHSISAHHGNDRNACGYHDNNCHAHWCC
eukprot:m.184834 g.184834  ORF g.184834 m.184834 type:complete len:120 (+) comp18106_c1_seq4:339-698(+)